MNKNKEEKNVILVGMTGSGKTALGRSLALKLGMGFFDFDEWICRRARKSIAQIFQQEGEEKFRQRENDAMMFVQNIRNHVIALGGGTIRGVLDWPKISHLGCTIWINTNVGQVIGHLLKHELGLKQRPLLADLADLPLADKKKLLNERLPALREQRQAIYNLADLEFVPTERSIRLNTMQLEALLMTGGEVIKEGGAETGFAPLSSSVPTVKAQSVVVPTGEDLLINTDNSSES